MYKMRLTLRCIGVNNEVYVEIYIRSLVGVQNKAYVGMCLFRSSSFRPWIGDAPTHCDKLRTVSQRAPTPLRTQTGARVADKGRSLINSRDTAAVLFL